MYYLVGVKDGFSHVMKQLDMSILHMIEQKQDEQLSFILEMKYEDTMTRFYEYLRDWEHVVAFRNTFIYDLDHDDRYVEAILTPYGMLINELYNNPMFRWFHYCFEYVLVIEVLQ